MYAYDVFFYFFYFVINYKLASSTNLVVDIDLILWRPNIHMQHVNVWMSNQLRE